MDDSSEKSFIIIDIKVEISVKINIFDEIKDERLIRINKNIFFDKFEEIEESVIEVVIIGGDIINFVDRSGLII